MTVSWQRGWVAGTQECAGYVVARIDRLLVEETDLERIRSLIQLRADIVEEMRRRFPDFDLEAEAAKRSTQRPATA